MSVDDPGRPNEPAVLDPAKIRWATEVSAQWWRNSHKMAPSPCVFTDATGRFSAPGLPNKVLYLGANPVACFWESGLGRDLNSRMPDDLNIAQSDLESRLEYGVQLNPTGLKIFNATDSAARRSIGARTSGCFSADHKVARNWSKALMDAGADGLLYESTRQSPGLCLALFETPATQNALGPIRKIGSAYEDAPLLASLLAENVAIIGS